MKKKEIHANFKFGQDALVGKGIEIRSNCNRDQTQFKARGISAARVTAFQGMIDAFLAPFTENLVPIETLGSIANHFLKVKNEDTAVGRFDFRVV